MANDEQAQVLDLRKRGVVYQLPDMEKALVRRNITYKTVEELDLKLDVYYPTNHARGTRLPAVIFLHGDASPDFVREMKESGQLVDWGRLTAASGLIAVTANHRSTEGLMNVAGVANDVDDLISYVREHSKELDINSHRLGIWMCSGGGLFGLRAALYETPDFVRSIVCYYGLTELEAYYNLIYNNILHGRDDEEDLEQPFPTFTEGDFAEFSAPELLRMREGEVAPLFIARAGLDFSELNDGLDRFIAEALAQNVNLTVLNHPTGQHAFDVLDDDARSREIIKATLVFLQTHLLTEKTHHK